MTMTTPLVRTGSALAAAGLLIGMLSACTPDEPTPKPTKTAAFATDEEAFAAAEETYRAYVDAVNTSDLDRPESFEPVYDFLTGTALAVERESVSKYQAAAIMREGDTRFDRFTPVAASGETITANLCIDVSAVQLTYSDGSSALPPDRLTRDSREVTFVSGGSPTGLAISEYDNPEGDFSC
ncbi:hypothetical protein ACIPV2_02990 [Microbacterium sp. NPDC089987]|uniref:hypothetical protein n=1 Tax=Microbacterium sp. NPDC089987 TaxID=3364202 RepID=UPI00381F34B2